MFRIKPHRGLTQTLCAPGPRDPTVTETELCLSVSCGGTSQQWSASGAGALGAAVLGTIAFISHDSKVMLKILQARLQQYVNCELPDVQAGFRKGRGTRDQIANICGSSKKEERSRKTSISVLLTMPKPLTVWITINCGKF